MVAGHGNLFFISLFGGFKSDEAREMVVFVRPSGLPPLTFATRSAISEVESSSVVVTSMMMGKIRLSCLTRRATI